MSQRPRSMKLDTKNSTEKFDFLKIVTGHTRDVQKRVSRASALIFSQHKVAVGCAVRQCHVVRGVCGGG